MHRLEIPHASKRRGSGLAARRSTSSSPCGRGVFGALMNIHANYLKASAENSGLCRYTENPRLDVGVVIYRSSTAGVRATRPFIANSQRNAVLRLCPTWSRYQE